MGRNRREEERKQSGDGGESAEILGEKKKKKNIEKAEDLKVRSLCFLCSFLLLSQVQALWIFIVHISVYIVLHAFFLLFSLVFICYSDVTTLLFSHSLCFSFGATMRMGSSKSC